MFEVILEKSESKQKHDAAFVLRKKLNDEIKLELHAEFDRRRIETDAAIRSELRESNETNSHERVKATQKHEASLALRKKLYDEIKIEFSAEVKRR